MICKNKDCLREIQADFKMCPYCGYKEMVRRSENEIKAEVEKLRALTSDVRILTMTLLASVTLDWSLGGGIVPSEVIEASIVKNE